MIRFFLRRIALVFGLILVVGGAGVWALQVFYVQPKKACEAAGNWWAERWNECATPMDVRNLPRLPDMPTVSAPAAAPQPKP